jgi:LacI family transcriptional regulator
VIISECENRGYNLIFTSASIENNTVQLPNVIKAHDVDGIILYGDTDSLILNAIDQYSIPYVIVDAHSREDKKLCVSADYEVAAYMATRHLIELGHSRIAFIGNHRLQNHHTQTFSGFRRAVEEKAITIPVTGSVLKPMTKNAQPIV